MIRQGTTTLFAARNVFDGTVIGQCQPRHRHQQFLRFLDRLEAAVDLCYDVHAHPFIHILRWVSWLL